MVNVYVLGNESVNAWTVVHAITEPSNLLPHGIQAHQEDSIDFQTTLNRFPYTPSLSPSLRPLSLSTLRCSPDRLSHPLAAWSDAVCLLQLAWATPSRPHPPSRRRKQARDSRRRTDPPSRLAVGHRSRGDPECSQDGSCFWVWNPTKRPAARDSGLPIPRDLPDVEVLQRGVSLRTLQPGLCRLLGATPEGPPPDSPPAALGSPKHPAPKPSPSPPRERASP